MKFSNKIILVFVLVFSINTFSQQDPHYTQYMYNPMSVNPAYAGSPGFASVTFLARSQWLGLDNAPDSQTLAYDVGLDWKGVGLGFNIVNDGLGPSEELSFDANLSYGIRISDEAKLALGLKLGGKHLSVNWSRVNKRDLDDSNAQDVSTFLPNMGAGLYYYTERLYFGLASPNILKSSHKKDNLKVLSRENIHVFSILGYVFDVSESLKFKPSALAKLSEGSPMSVDLSANFLFDDVFNAGLAWRWGDSVSAMLGFQANREFYIGYGYDLTSSALNGYNRGSHELVLQYQFVKHQKIISPRYF